MTVDLDEVAAVSAAVAGLRAAFAGSDVAVHDVYDADDGVRVGVWVVAGAGRLAIGVHRIPLAGTVWPWPAGMVEVAGAVPAAGDWTVDGLTAARLVELM